MPPREVTCAICGQTVLKARTRHIGDGKRACKTHEGVMEKAEQVHTDYVSKIKDGREKLKQTREFSHPHHNNPLDMKMRCHLCGHEVMHASDLMLEALITSRRRELEGLPSNLLFDFPQIVEDVRSRKGDVLGCYVYNKSELTDEQWKTVCQHVRKELRVGIEMFQFVGVCVKCVDRLGLPDKLKNLPSLTPEQLMKLSIVTESAIDDLAKNAMARQDSTDV